MPGTSRKCRTPDMKKKPTPEKCIVTDAHRDQFSAAVVFWADVLGLGDWRITVSETRASRGVMAEVHKMDLEQRSATIRVGKDFNYTPVTERTISETALHECCHIFLYEFKRICQSDVATEDDIFSVEHRLINVLERRLSAASPLGPKP